jgi:hypothetical protein
MISWDPNVLQIIGVEEGPFLSTSSHSIQGTLFLGDDPLLWKTKNGVGFIESGITCTRVASTAGPRNEGLLATVRFEVVGAGTSLIDISESVVSDVTLMEAVATVNSATVDVLSPSSGPSVVFSPSGLASGTIWNVTCNGETKSSGGDITFQLAVVLILIRWVLLRGIRLLRLREQSPLAVKINYNRHIFSVFWSFCCF